jgi:hypothetical protein
VKWNSEPYADFTEAVHLQNVPLTIYCGCACRHGLKQVGSNWADGVAHITECPIKPGAEEIYDFTVKNQRGTAFWHAHAGWLRATVYGAFITKPNATTPYPFAKPDEEVPLVLGKNVIPHESTPTFHLRGSKFLILGREGQLVCFMSATSSVMVHCSVAI